MRTIDVAIQKLPGSGDIPLPVYMTRDSAGMDIAAAIDTPITIEPRQTVMIPTGFAMGLPPGFEAQIRPRSGLAIKHGVTVVNAPGTIDADYRGEVKVGLINLSDTPFTIHRGDRIAQMIVAPVTQAVWQEVDELDGTERAAGGFGHTGLSS